MNSFSLRRLVLPAVAGISLLGWSSVALASAHADRPMVTAPRAHVGMYVAPAHLVPQASTRAHNVAPVARAPQASRALPATSSQAKPSGIPR
jgi:hypothetical protein